MFVFLFFSCYCCFSRYFIVCVICAVGEYGVAVTMSRDKLSPSEQQKYDAAWQANAFNGYANDLMSLHRSLQDTRDAEYAKLF